MSSIPWEQMPVEMQEVFVEIERQQRGLARQARWQARDGWMIAYTTERVDGGPHDGKFLTMAYKPVGKGARSGYGAAREWKRVYLRAFSTRKSARARAEALYQQHSRKRQEEG